MAFSCGTSGRHKLTGTEKAKESGKEAGKVLSSLEKVDEM